MEPQQQHEGQIQQHKSADQGGGSSGGKASNYLCRQSSTRWTPTTDQIRILKDLYYNSGVRSPSADQIQKISARLRQYGKIEGKNVFYWFQNHKARERQKKRFTANSTPPNFSEHHIPMQRASNIRCAGVSCPSSSAAGMVPVGQMVGGCGYGHMSAESNIRECAMNGGVCSFPSQSFQWAGSNLYPQSYSVLEGTRNCSADYGVQFRDEEEQEKAPELETLPLFPLHGGDPPASGSFCGTMMRAESENCYPTSCHWFSATETVSARTSLELSLNSYGDQWPNF